MAFKFTNMINKIVITIGIIFYCAGAFGANQIKVRAEKVQKYDFYDSFTSFGKIRYELSRDFIAQNSGNATFVCSNQDNNVKKGEKIFGINETVAEAALSSTKSLLDSEDANYARDSALRSKGMISSEAWQKSKNARDAAKLNFEKAKLEYDNSVIHAPFDGKISTPKFLPGDTIKTGEYLFSIFAPSSKVIFLDIPETLRDKIQKNEKIQFQDAQNTKYTGSVYSISNTLSNSGLIPMKIIVDKEIEIPHNSYVSVNIIYNKHQGFGITERAIVRNDSGYYLYVLENSEARLIPIKLGARIFDMVEIIAPEINDQTLIITEGLTKIADKAKVEVTE